MTKNTRALFALSALVGAAAATSSFADGGKELLLSGPIEQVDHGLEIVTVLGQKIKAPTDQLVVGEVVNVYGQLASDGTIIVPTVQSTSKFGTNGDAVFLKGMVTSSDAALGRAVVDGITIDYTSELSNPDFVMPASGDVIAAAGTEPAMKGLLVAAGTGLAAYGFTGVKGSIFTSPAAMIASGSKPAGMTGSGAAAAGMTGSGAISAGMTGSGANAAGMTGSGAVSAGMTGSGRSSAGMTGSGINAAGMTGSGAISAGMTGSGVNAAGMTGSGLVTAGMTGSGRN